MATVTQLANVEGTRRHAVVVFTDAVGYSAMMARDGPATLGLLREHHASLFGGVTRLAGTIVNTRGDGALLEFRDPVTALTSITEFMTGVQQRNASLAVDRRMSFRVGINLGEVLVADDALHGDVVNVAARLQQLAEPGSICVSDDVRVAVGDNMPLGFHDLGFHEVKGVRYPVRVWRVAARGDRTMAAEVSATKPSIAVLPFANLSGDREQEYFADGLAEDIIASLAHSSWLFVIARSSSFVYRDGNRPLSTIFRELGVRYLVSGSVRHAGAQLRVSAELTDGRNCESVWAAHYDRPVSDLFALQEEISATIVGTIEPMFLRREEHRAAYSGPRDLQHWDLLMRARWHYWRSSRNHNIDTQRILQQAIALQPNDVAGLSLLAFSYLTDIWSGWADDPKALIAESYRLAMKAVALNDMDSFAHFTLGVAMACIGDMERAIAEQRRALELYPHFAAAAAELGRLLAFSGETAIATSLVYRAIAASPTDPRKSLWLFTLGIAAFVDGRDQEAAKYAADAVAQRPDWFFNHYLLAACRAACGELDRAREALAEAKRLMPRFSAKTLKVGHPFVHAAHRDRYIASLRRAGWDG